MKRISVLATALTVAGSALLMPTVASANPVISVTSDGSPIDPGTVGGYEQPVHIDINGCTTDAGDPGYIGYFLTWANGDPGEQFEALTGTGGTMSVDTTIPLQPVEKVMDLNWYCSDAPVSDGPEAAPYSVLYLSPTYTYTLAADPGAGANRLSASATSSLRTRSAKKSAAKNTVAKKLAAKKSSVAAKVSGAVTVPGSALQVTTDPNALPTIDKMGITGPNAAALKAKVDKRANDNLAVARLIAALSRKPAPTPTSAQYVTAAFQVLAGKAPAASAMSPYVSQLDEGGFRVNTVEDIALTKHNAAFYNK